MWGSPDSFTKKYRSILSHGSLIALGPYPLAMPGELVGPTKHCTHWIPTPPVGSADLTPSAAKYGMMIFVQVSFHFADTTALARNMKNKRHGCTLRNSEHIWNIAADAWEGSIAVTGSLDPRSGRWRLEVAVSAA